MRFGMKPKMKAAEQAVLLFLAKYMLMALMLIMIYSCGNRNQGESAGRKEYQEAEIARRRELNALSTTGDTIPTTAAKPRIEPPVKGPEILAGQAKPGSCAEAALRFSIAIGDIDSSTALALCNDTMRAVVRAMMTNPAQAENLRRGKEEMGFHIKSAKIVENYSDENHCTACVTAVIKGNEIEDCGFQLTRVGDKWLVRDFGSTEQHP